MKTRIRGWMLLAALAAFVMLPALRFVQAQTTPPKGAGKDAAFTADREVFQFLLTKRKDIKRTVKNIAMGVETVTESDVAEVAAKIQEHVAAMHTRVKDGRGIHLRDPLFRELFANYEKIDMKIEKTPKGVKVTETSKDERVAQLIQAHAVVVSKFIENGREEVMKNHAVPEVPKKPETPKK